MLNDKQRSDVAAFAEYGQKSAAAGTLRALVFSKPTGGDCLKIRAALRVIGGQRVLQLESSFTEGRVSQQNVSFEQVVDTVFQLLPDAFQQADLSDESGSAVLMASKKGKITAVLPAALRRALDTAPSADVAQMLERFQKNDHEKQRILNGSEPFLIALDISDKNGRVHDKRQAKFRQICRFAELVTEALRYLPPDGPLYVADLCCGKSYLSFAVYHSLTAVAGREVEMLCVDLKKSVMDECTALAARLGFTGMHFQCADISNLVPKRAPDMVISLHACDTATDVVLDFAARHRASVILSTPCCQRELSRHLACEPLAFIADRPILRKKFCDAATDALRLARLECMGYRADALEFIDPEDTPKNIMLRAYRKKGFRADAPSILQKREQYIASYRFLCGGDPPPFPDIQ